MDLVALEWPLWGLRLEPHRPAGVEGAIKIGDAALYQPTWQQWWDMENGDVVTEHAGDSLWAERLGLQPSAMPPVCLMRLARADAEGRPHPAVEDHEPRVRVLLDALRLHAAGDFVDPSETGRYVTHPSGVVERAVSIFRSALYEVRVVRPYQVDDRCAAEVGQLAQRIAVLRTDPLHLNATLALDSFRLSFGFTATPAERALHRFAALEAVLGPLGEPAHGVSFARRIARALDGDERTAEDWLQSARPLRDGVAHGDPSLSPDEHELQVLESTTRSVLRAYVAQDPAGNGHPVRRFNAQLASPPGSLLPSS